jgi:uncharacterized protein
VTDNNLRHPNLKGCVPTWTGRRFSLANPDPDDVDIVDIVMGLARQCRFNGQSSGFYSVAQHSVLVARRCPRAFRLHGLLHDAPEAYIGDIVSPFKELINSPMLALIEQRIYGAIARRFGLGAGVPEEVHRADNFLLGIERRDLFAPNDWWPQPSDGDHEQIEPMPEGLAAIYLTREYIHLTDDRAGFSEDWFAERAREAA